MHAYCTVLLLSTPHSFLTYSVPDDLPRELWFSGGRVLIPLGSGVRVGLFVSWDTEAPNGMVCKPLLWPIDIKPLLDPSYIDFVRDLSVRQMESPGKILSRVLPAGIREVPAFRNSVGRVTLSDILQMNPGQRLEQAKAWICGDLQAIFSKPKVERLYSLTCESPWPVRPNASAQLDVLRYLDVHGVCSSRALQQQFGKAVSQPLAALCRKGLVAMVESRLELLPEERGPAPDFQLSGEQEQAVKQFKTLLDSRQAAVALLFGVTGSGKTAVYLELVRHCLTLGRHAMLLAPEVAIAVKLLGDVRTALPEASVTCYHGYLGVAERERIFLELAEVSTPQIIVGTRSCLFLPVEPGLVILDEEHDASFKQDEGLVYQAKELAYGRIARSRGLLLMGSATPDIKAYQAALAGSIELARLRERAGEALLPKVRLVDLRAEPPIEGPFAASVHQTLIETLQRGEQVIILHNRRGYAPVMYCESCSEPVKCPHCQVSMTLHKRREALLCHYCGYSLAFPTPCPSCRAVTFVPLGSGTERLEEFLGKELPSGTSVLRLDRDTSRRAGGMQEILEAFSRQEAQVLVGTQMLSKGHHFPGVTLVVVVDGDLGLNLPDYRATERCFQLLVQVAGRAGRGEKPGQVLIQTRNPGHYCWQYILHNDYEGFFAKEIALRKLMGYPPFVKLALVRLSMPADWPEKDFLAAFGRHLGALAAQTGLRALGPVPAPLSVLRGRKRFHCLLKGQDWAVIRGVCSGLRELTAREKKVRMSVDLDPVDML